MVNCDSKWCPFFTQAALWAAGRRQAAVAQRPWNGFHIARALGRALERNPVVGNAPWFYTMGVTLWAAGLGWKQSLFPTGYLLNIMLEWQISAAPELTKAGFSCRGKRKLSMSAFPHRSCNASHLMPGLIYAHLYLYLRPLVKEVGTSRAKDTNGFGFCFVSVGFLITTSQCSD